MAEEKKDDYMDNSSVIVMSKTETVRLTTLLMAQLGDFALSGHAKGECLYLVVKDSDGKIRTLTFVLETKTGVI